MNANEPAPHRNATVLVVDDNTVNLSTLFDFLYHEKFHVLVAQSGESALNIIKERPPDIILLDVIMPDMDGFEVCRRLKAEESTRHIPIIFITALADVEHKVQGFQLGAVDFITKPFQQKEVVARVETHLRLCSLQQQLQKQVERLEWEIQKRQRLETSLREREQQFEEIAENVREIFFVATADFKHFIYVNPIYEVIWGQRREFLYESPKAWLRHVHAADRKTVLPALKQLFYNFEEFSQEFRVLRYGATRWVWARAFPVFDESGRLCRFVGVVEDITKRRRVEEKLRRSEAKMRSILNNTLQSFLLVDLQGKLVLWNPLANRLAHQLWGKELAEGENLFEYLRGAQQEKLCGMMRSALEGNIGIFESSFEDEAGQNIALEFNLMPVSTENDDIIGVCWSISDITERKRTADALRRAKEAAESANQAKSAFLANMSHELRTPLNGILGYTQILHRDRTLTPVQKNAIHIIHQSGQHLLTMINDVLDLSKIEARKMDLDLKSFHLPNLLSDLMDMLAMKAQQKGILYRYDAAPELPASVIGDEKRLRQVLLNLLSNAVKFTEAGRGLSLRVTLAENTEEAFPSGYANVRFEVEDQGVGIPSELREEIFQPFRQLRQTSLKVEGTGLGLSISQKLVRLMGGELRVESELGRGSCFCFELEFELPKEETTELRQPSSGSVDVRYVGPARTVLIADDDLHNRSVLKQFLLNLGFQVIEAQNGVEALQRAKEYEPDLLLLDLVMPLMDGFETARKIRQIPLLQKMPIIAVSASVLENTRERSLKAGCDRYLPKPISFNALLEIFQDIMKDEWLPTEDVTAQSEPELEKAIAIMPPAQELLEKLYDYALKGDVLELLTCAEELKEEEPQQVKLFGEKLELLAQNFAIDELQSFLKQFLE